MPMVICAAEVRTRRTNIARQRPRAGHDGEFKVRPQFPRPASQNSDKSPTPFSLPCVSATLKGSSQCLILMSWCASTKPRRVQVRRERFVARGTGRREQSRSRSKLAGEIRPMLINGEVGLVWAPRGHLLRVLRFSIADGKIGTVDVIAERTRLNELELAVLTE